MLLLARPQRTETAAHHSGRARMTYVKFRGTLPPDGGTPGAPYENEVMQLMHLRWM
jgi:hypothetical protein